MKRLFFLIFIFWSAGGFAQSENPEEQYQLAESFMDFPKVDSALILFESAAIGFEKNKNISRFLWAKLKQAQCYHHLGEFAVSNAILKNISEKHISEFNADLDLKYNTYIIFSDNYSFYNKVDSSILFLNEAESHYTEHEENMKEGVARLYTRRGNIYIKKGEYDLALNAFEKALEKARKENAGANIFSSIYENIGVIYFYKYDMEQALEYYLVAYDIRIKELGAEHLLVARSLYNIGLIYEIKGYFDKALDNYQQALDIRKKLQGANHPYLADIYNTIGNIYLAKRHYEQALECYERDLEIRSKSVGPTHPNNATAYQNIAVLWVSRDQPEKALAILEKGAPILDKNPAPWIEAEYWTTVGYVNYYNKNYKKSLHGYQKAYDILKGDLEAESVRVGEAMVDVGTAHLKLGNLDIAKDFMKGGLERMKGFHEEGHNFVVEAYLYLSDHARAATQRDSFFYYVNLAEAACLEKGTFERENTIPDFKYILFPFNLLEIYRAKVTFLKEQARGQEDLERALQIAKKGKELVYEIRKTYIREASKYDLSKEARKLYEIGFQVAIDLYEQTGNEKYLEQAFGFAESGKGLILLEGLQGLKAETLFNVPDTVLALEQKLKMELSFNKQELLLERESKGNDADTERVAKYQNKIEALSARYEELYQQIKKEYKEYYNFRCKDVTVPLDDLQKTLQDHELMIQYFLVDSFCYVIGIEKDQVWFRKKSYIFNLDEKVKNLQKILEDGSADAWAREGRDWFRILLEPLHEKIINKKLIIVPDKHLNFLPFELLLTEKTEPAVSFKNLPYLVRSNPVCYNYSASLYYNFLNKSKGNSSQKFMSLAPDFKAWDLPDLPFAKKEAKDLGRRMHGHFFIEDKATETLFKSKAANYKIIHLATHTDINYENPFYSNLVFSPDTGKVDDGRLYVYELYGQKINAELVTLSACQSGIGTYQSGEGVVSLANGFSYAGCPNILMSLWPVSDKSTFDIMEKFYNNLNDGLDKDVALQKAKLDFLDNAPKGSENPYLWSGFVLVGNDAPISQYLIEFPKNFLRVTFLLLGLIFILFLGKIFTSKK